MKQMILCMRKIPAVLGSGVAEIFGTAWSNQRAVKGELWPPPHPHSPAADGAYPR